MESDSDGSSDYYRQCLPALNDRYLNLGNYQPHSIDPYLFLKRVLR